VFVGDGIVVGIVELRVLVCNGVETDIELRELKVEVTEVEELENSVVTVCDGVGSDTELREIKVKVGVTEGGELEDVVVVVDEDGISLVVSEMDLLAEDRGGLEITG
jgi:hypothetical protein